MKLKEINIVTKIPPEDVILKCDPNRLEQVIINLFSNAVDAVANVHHPEIIVSVSRHQDRGTICVHDNGPGLSDSVMPHLFEPFFTTKEAGSGLGLGLAISADIVAAMGGTIHAHDRPEGGAEFILDLPLAPPEAHHG